MNGSAPLPATKHERVTTAAEICVLIPQEAGVTISIRAAAAPSTGISPGMDEIKATARVVWRRRPGTTPVVHAYAVNSCVEVPLCGSCLSTGSFEELPPPPAHLGPYRRCRKCMAALGRMG
ncbi:MAG TPA: hypothetical protein HA263_09115 [Methanoregulaceae archaeon]|nr:hypothetical protein [Methanoregulaceae archaeon]